MNDKRSNNCIWKTCLSLRETTTALVMIHLTFTITCQYLPVTVAVFRPSTIFLMLSPFYVLNAITLATTAMGIITVIAIDNTLETFWSVVSYES